MKKTVIISNGNILSLISLKKWLDLYKNEVVAVFITTKLPSASSNIYGVFNMLISSGVKYTFFKLFCNLIFPLALKVAGKPCSLRSYFKRSSVEFIYTKDINSEKNMTRIRAFCPDIILSFGATSKFKVPLINASKRVTINAHYALLPEYAGLSPYFWYLFNGEARCGCTLHVVSEVIDAGNIIEQNDFKTDGIVSVSKMLIEQMKLISPMLINFYEGKTSEKTAAKQDLARRSYYRHPTRGQVKAFLYSGKKFIKMDDVREMTGMLS